MALNICLGNYIEPKAGAELQKPGCVGIVAGADGIDIVLLHQGQIPEGLLPADGVACHRVAVVPVHPPELNGHAV